MIAFDVYLSQMIAGAIPHNAFMDTFFSFFALRGSLAYVWALPVLYLFAYEEIPHHIFIWRMSITVLVNYILFTILKLIVASPRPLFQAGTTIIHAQLSRACPTDFSFPSGHATLAVGVAVVMAQTDKKRRVLYYISAFLICLSRIYLQCHFVSDVAAGALLGYVVGLGVCKIIKGKVIV